MNKLSFLIVAIIGMLLWAKVITGFVGGIAIVAFVATALIIDGTTWLRVQIRNNRYEDRHLRDLMSQIELTLYHDHIPSGIKYARCDDRKYMKYYRCEPEGLAA